MIVVENTKELEEKYNLDRIKDDEKIIVQGGFKGKDKYNKDKYYKRVTYDARTLKLIIQQMRKIENQIPRDWNELQKIKYIYTVLAQNIEYEKDASKYATGNCSNLMGIITGKSICAGYSLIFKEMMDRQAIECEYMRGIIPRGGNIEKHAWNVLTVQGKKIPIDLTWDSNRLSRGEKGLNYFGTDRDFFKYHITDYDEKKYQYCMLQKGYVDKIDISRTRAKSDARFQMQQNNEPPRLQKEYKKGEKAKIPQKDAIDYAIEKTYKKLLRIYDKETAKNIISANMKKYIEKGEKQGFTREDNARDVIVENSTPDETIEFIAGDYVKKCMNNGEKYDPMENAIITTAKKYNESCASKALVQYIRTGITTGFTRENNARRGIMYNINNDMALNVIIHGYLDERIMQIENVEKMQQRYFSADEFSELPLTENKKEKIIKSISWIKERAKQIFNSKKEEKNIEKKEGRSQEER